MTQNSTSMARRPRARSDKAATTSGSARIIAQHLRQQDLRSFECLGRTAIPQLGVRQDLGCNRYFTECCTRHGEWAGRLDDQQVSDPCGRLGDKLLLDRAVLECANWRVD